MTGPLAQQIAQVREALDAESDGFCAWCQCSNYEQPHASECEGRRALAALSSIERHVQDMETALRAGARECPVCFGTEWEIDYMRTNDGEMRVDTCTDCGWPPPTPYGVEEWREKWLITGETDHSHPSPPTLRVVGRLVRQIAAARAALPAREKEEE